MIVPRPTKGLLAPDGGIDGPYVRRNWGHLTREDVEALDSFGNFLGEDIIYMGSMAFRYFVPSVMILFLSRPENIDFEGFNTMVNRCESVFQCHPHGSPYDQIALTRPQAEAFRDWFGQLMTIIRKFELGSFEAEYQARLRGLRARAKIFTPDIDFDAATIKAIMQQRT